MMNWTKLLNSANEINDDIESNLNDTGEVDHIDELILSLIEEKDTPLRNAFIQYFKSAIDILLHYAKHGDHDKSQYAGYERTFKRLHVQYNQWDSDQIPIELMTAEELIIWQQENQ